jgi:hypothetical protein
MPSYQIQAGFAVGAKGRDYAFFVIKDVVSEEMCYYDFLGSDQGFSANLPLSVSVWSDWSDIFVTPCNIRNFAGAVAFNSNSAIVVSYRSYLVFMDGPAKGKIVNTSGWQLATPGVSITAGTLKFNRYVPPLQKGWPSGHFLIGVWVKYGVGALPADGSVPKFWGTLTLSNRRTDFNQFSSLDSRLTWPWMWTPNNPKLKEAPNSGDGKWDLPTAKIARLYGNGSQPFAELEGFEDSLTGGSFTGGNCVTTIQQKIRHGEQPNGWMGDYRIYWILSNRE